MKYYTMGRFVMSITAIVILTGYHLIEMHHGMNTTREERGYYGPG